MSEAPLPIASGALAGNTTGNVLTEGASSTAARRLNALGNATRSKTSHDGPLMVFLVFIANFLVFGFFKSLGMLTRILNKEFGATMNVYVLMCITYSLNCGAGPLSCYLTRRYSPRTIALVGTSMVTCGLILSWFAESLTFLYFSLGVLTGIGSGLTYPTGVILVSNYFIGTKNAAIANALVVSGSPIGGMIMPFIMSFLSEMYTSRGAFLIIGGVMLHAILCVSGFRPLPKAKPIYRDSNGHNTSPVVPLTDVPNSNSNDDEQNANLQVYKESDSNDRQVCSCSTGMLATHETGCRQELGGISGKAASVQTIRQLPMWPSSPIQIREEEHGHDDIDTQSVHGLTYRKRGNTNIPNGSTDTVVIKEVDKNSTINYSKTLTGTGSQPYILSLDHSCIILWCPSKTDVILKQRGLEFIESERSVMGGDSGDTNVSGNYSNPDIENREKDRKCSKFTSPFENSIFIFLLCSNTSTAISTANIYLMVSQLVDESGDGYSRTSLVYLLFSFADLGGRLIGAFLCDKRVVKPSVIYTFGLVSAGIISAFLATLSSFIELCVGVFAYGFSSGLHIGIYGVLLTNIVGLEKIHVGYGLSMFINGTIQCIAILLSGSLIAKYSSCFTWLAPIFGGILACGGLIWICGLLLCRGENRNNDGDPDTPQDNNAVKKDDEGDDAENNNNCDVITHADQDIEI